MIPISKLYHFAKLSRKLPAVFALSSLLALPVTLMADTAVIKTPLGDIEIELLTNDAPKTVANFLNYVQSGKYYKSFVHKSLPGVAIQGGGFTWAGLNSNFIFTFEPVENEFKVSNTRGTVAMAKLDGQPDSATSEWFINLADNSATLDNQNGGYTVFGRVTGNGMAVADAIGQLAVMPFFKHPELPVIGYTIDDFNNQDPVFESNLVMTEITADATPPEQGFVMNPGLNDAWYNPVTDGQGFFITVFPDLNLVNLAWFTYDTELPADESAANLGSPGHRWLTALGSIDGDTAVLNIDFASGGLFDTSTVIAPVEHTDPPGSDGTITLTFADCKAGLVEYDIPSINRQGTVPIERVADDNIALCEALSSQ